jgi:hypothetical protein
VELPRGDRRHPLLAQSIAKAHNVAFKSQDRAMRAGAAPTTLAFPQLD